MANESIGAEAPAELPDKNKIIYVYCRSGNRVKQATEKLAAPSLVECLTGLEKLKSSGGANERI